MRKVQNLKNNKGITLIALIITVIVMIILAGIAINLTIGDNGIFIKTKIAEEEYRGGTVEEQRDLWRGDRELYKHVGSELKSLDSLLADLRGKNLLTDEEVEIIKKDKVITIGSHVIDFSVEEIEVDYSKLGAGLYQTGTTTLIKSWEQLKADGEIIVTETTLTYIDKSLEGDLVISNEVTNIQGTSSSCGGPPHQITGLYIPSSVVTIGGATFAYCSNIQKLIIEEGVETIGADAFKGCTKIKEINLPEGLRTIGMRAFMYCKELTSIELPSTLTTIEKFALDDNDNLSSIKVAKGNPVYDSRENCNGVIQTNTNTLVIGCKETKIPNSVVAIGEGVFRYSKIESIEIPDSVTSIETYAFYGCWTIKNITIPSTVVKMGSDAFGSWKEDQTINVQFKKSELPSEWKSSWKSSNVVVNYLPEE